MIKGIKRLLTTIENILKSVQHLNKEIDVLNRRMNVINEILIDITKQNAGLTKPSSNELNQYERQVYSQNGEDGILTEIFRRLNIKSGNFLEIGVQDGLETNTTFLLIQGWTGTWVESDADHCSKVRRHFSIEIEAGNLTVVNQFVNVENIEKMIKENEVPVQLELLSIDIDSNDYWIWKEINSIMPKVVVIEYNAFFPPTTDWVMNYDAEKVWDDSTVFNSSLLALKMLGEQKGYRLVACCYNGVNAFFVREDLLDNSFPLNNIENIYQPIRYYLKKNYTIKKGYEKGAGLND